MFERWLPCSWRRRDTSCCQLTQLWPIQAAPEKDARRSQVVHEGRGQASSRQEASLTVTGSDWVPGCQHLTMWFRYGGAAPVVCVVQELVVVIPEVGRLLWILADPKLLSAAAEASVPHAQSGAVQHA